MASSRTCLASLILGAATLWCSSPLLSAAEPWPQAAGAMFADPQAMLQRFFGEETQEDQEALAKIDVSPREEQQMGQATVEAFLADLKRRGVRVTTRGKDADYLRALVETIRPLMQNAQRYPRITVYVAQSSECDARALPGGTLVFFRGLLEQAENEAAVVGIVGHELSHLDRGHLLWRLRRLKLAEQTFSGGAPFSPEAFFSSGATMMQVFTRPFRPEYEAEADEDGARWAYAAGYDPRETAKLFLALADRKVQLPIAVPAFFQSHPDPAGRHRAIMALYEKLHEEQPADKLYIGAENLRLRVARSKRAFDE